MVGVNGAQQAGGGLLSTLDQKKQAGQIREVPVNAIEPDPNQPREHFDPEKLQELAASIEEVGLLQEPAVYPIELDEAGLGKRYRLLYGERRWRAHRDILKRETIRCKVLPNTYDKDLLEEAKKIDQQEAENAQHEALSAVEEARTIRAKLQVLRRLNPEVPQTELMERLAKEQKAGTSTVYKLLDLLDSPEALRQAIKTRKIVSREVAFLLAQRWTALLKKHRDDTKAKREVLLLNRVREWATAQQLEFKDETLNDLAAKYADTLLMDTKSVRAAIKKGLAIERAAETEFAELVQRVIERGWTVKEVRRALRPASRRSEAVNEPDSQLYEQTQTQGRCRLIVHLDRVRDPAIATSESLEALRGALRDLQQELDALLAARAAQVPAVAAVDEVRA